MTLTEDQIADRAAFARALCQRAGETALGFFTNRDGLVVDRKGAQDWVSEADRAVEAFIRQEIRTTYPEDGIVGEEEAPHKGTSGFDWVIDPIDGTTNFVNGIPAWTIVLAGVLGARTELGVIHDPNVSETYAARRGHGATLNDRPLQVATGTPLDSGTVAVGYSNRVERGNVVPLVRGLVERGAMFHRNASGALSIAYVAAGRVLGYLEEHMNAWDCLAGQLLVAEAGGRVEEQDAQDMLRAGGRVIVAAPQVFDELRAMAESAWAQG